MKGLNAMLESMYESIYAYHICNASFQKKPYFYKF